MHDPREPHITAVKHILRYPQGTTDLGLFLTCIAPSALTVYTDADWAGYPDTRRSTSGYASSLVITSISGLANVGIRFLDLVPRLNIVQLRMELPRLLGSEIHHPPLRTTLVYYDNVSAVYLSSNPVQHQRTKHIEIDLHFVRERVAIGAVRVLHVPTSSQFADLFTKGLPSSVFMDFRSGMNVRSTGVPRGGRGVGEG
ncbi:hypothetical protein U9M48_002164, partial [Paspalum notatum var. saurae]